MRPREMVELPVLVKGRQPLLAYHLEHAHGQFYILTNNGRYSDFEVRENINLCVCV